MKRTLESCGSCGEVDFLIFCFSCGQELCRHCYGHGFDGMCDSCAASDSGDWDDDDWSDAIDDDYEQEHPENEPFNAMHEEIGL